MLCFGVSTAAADEAATLPPEQILQQARSMASEGVLLEAVQGYEAYLDLRSNNVPARAELSQLLFKVGRYADAADHALLVIDHDPDNALARDNLNQAIKKLKSLATEKQPLTLLQLARITQWSGNFKEAEQPYARYLAIKPGDADARYEYAEVLNELDRKDEAIRELQRAIATKPEHPVFQLTLATWLSYDEERLDEARVMLEKLVRTYPDMADAHAHLGDVYRFMDMPDQANDQYTKTLQLDAAHQRAKEGLWQVQLQVRPLARARKAQWTKRYEESAKLYLEHFEEMAAKRKRLNDLKQSAIPSDAEAIRTLERYIKETPPELDVRVEYADVLSQAGRPREAIEELRQVAEQRPDDRKTRLKLARQMSYSKEHLDEAQIELEKIVEDFEGDAEAEALRGDVYRYRGKLSQAFTAYNKSLIVNPGYARASEGIEAVEELLRPQLFLQGGYTHDRSTEFKHTVVGPQYRSFLQNGRIVADLLYRYHTYEQDAANINAALGGVSDVRGNEVAASVSVNASTHWSIFGEVGIISYDEAEDAVVGNGGLSYTGNDLEFTVGGRQHQAVDDHYNLNALLDDVRISDFFIDARYFHKHDHWLGRWDIEGHFATGSFSDDNGRTRIAGHILHVGWDTADLQVKYGLGARYQAYDEVSTNYFSPDSYTGYGPALRIDHHLTERISWGASALAYYIDEAGEYDLQGGGYIYYLLHEDLEIGLRADHGESTTSDDNIETTSAFGEIRYGF